MYIYYMCFFSYAFPFCHQDYKVLKKLFNVKLGYRLKLNCLFVVAAHPS